MATRAVMQMLSCRPAVTHVEPPPTERWEETLEQRFGLRSFYPWQREAIEAVVDHPRKVLLVAPTGGGKSLCYQLPAVLLPGVAVVISPLISLMEDQVRSLDARGIPATYLASTLDFEERKHRFAGIRAGKYKLVFVAPERLSSDGFTDLLSQARVSLLAVDEAHCIVQWGHDFRPDYMRIGPFIERVRPPRVIACTATATLDSRREILLRLGLSPEHTKVILKGFARPNLELRAVPVDGRKQTLQLVKSSLLEALHSAKKPEGGAIVYAATRKTTEKLAEELQDEGFGAQAYHAGLSAETRSQVQAGFADRSLPVVVATNAFGMGIDRSDVRVVVHAQPSASIEAYYQEVGRAGRDGSRALGVLLLAPFDIPLRRRLCELGGDGHAAPAAQAERSWSQFRELLRYFDAQSCRHDFILRYFGDEEESLGGCGKCDVCQRLGRQKSEDPEAFERDALIVRKVLSGVARARERGGMQVIAEMLRGARTERVVRFGFSDLSTFGLLQDKPQDELLGILRSLVAAGFVDVSAGDYPVPRVTALGGRVMRGETPSHLSLPAPAPAAARASKSSKKAPRSDLTEGALIEPLDPHLLEALRLHRGRIAREMGVAPFLVAHDRTLQELAQKRPASVSELSTIHGMGKIKIERYGSGLLDIVTRMAPARAIKPVA